MDLNKTRVCVVGCGVIGLSTAVAIQQLKLNACITIIADNISPNTTSDGAAGLWEPMVEGTSQQESQINDWIVRTGRYLESLVRSKDSCEAGVGVLSGYYLSNIQDQAGGWSQLFYGCRKLDVDEMSAFFPNYVNGWFLTAFQIECSKYLPWLMKRFKENGGNFIKRYISSMSEVAEDYDVIVNCTGLGAVEFVNDDSMYPVRGQILRVKAPWVKHFIIDIDCDDRDIHHYIIPCQGSVVVGGTFQKNSSKLKIDAIIRKKILIECSKMLPSIADAEIITEWVGLRPGRPTVRIERECIKIGERTIQVVHNYGHGGRGVSLHWGCALDAANIVQQIIDDNRKRMISRL